MNRVSFGSFGPIASQRQGSPRGTATQPQPSLGGAVNPPTISNASASGGSLGNIAARLGTTGAVKTARVLQRGGGATLSAARAATKPRKRRWF